MARRTYRVSVATDIDIEIDDSLVDVALSDGWKRTFYDLQTRNRVVEFITYNVLVNRSTLSGIDGFADQADSLVSLHPPDWEIDCEGELSSESEPSDG